MGKKIMKEATVWVIDEVKDNIPKELIKTKILNLGRGVSCEKFENEIKRGYDREEIVKKNIKNKKIYKDNQLYLVSSPYVEKRIKNACAISDEMTIRGGYLYDLSNGFSSLNRKVLNRLKNDKKILLYAPTLRHINQDFLVRAIPDMDELIKVLKKENLFLILKMPESSIKDISYEYFKDRYSDSENILFWDNRDDIYEIFNMIDLAIIDYSPILYDLVKSGVKKFIRYDFDINEFDLVDDYEKMSLGKKCLNFAELLHSLGEYNKINSITDKEFTKINDLFFSYDSDIDNILTQVMEFKIDENRKLKTLYSFDIFDTLFSRKVYEPKAIFYYVRDKMMTSSISFDIELVEKFPVIRGDSERDVRDRKKKDPNKLDNKEYEITLEEIYDRIMRIYNLTEKQKKVLMEWEMEAEIANVIPLDDMINKALSLKDSGEDVILISDMYLSRKTIVQMLAKANPKLAKLPLYLSCDEKVQKSSNELFIKVYFDINYCYDRWIHHGDNSYSDNYMPQQLGIETIQCKTNNFNAYEKAMFNKIGTYDSYLVANVLRRNRLEINSNSHDYFSYSYVSLYFVPYVDWALKDALKNKLDTLYFISRDGYYLKMVADEIIKIKKYPLKTKYIYGSRRAWRVPSYIDEVDAEHFSNFGNVTNDLTNFNELLKSLWLSEEEFDICFPELSYIKNKKYDVDLLNSINPIFKNSKKYSEIILEKAKKSRGIVVDYLKQEINFKERFAFVEFWGRGYTQVSLHRLLKCACPSFSDTIFYYSRSIYEDDEHIIRKNFTSNQNRQIFIESIFSNIDIDSVTSYERKKDVVVPVIQKNKYCDLKLHHSIEKNLVKFCHDFYANEYLNEDIIERNIFEFALDYYANNPNDKYLGKYLGPLHDAVNSYHKSVEFAPKVNLKDFFNILFSDIKNIHMDTRNFEMSIYRSSFLVRKVYHWKKTKYFSKIWKRIVKKIKTIIKRFLGIFLKKYR